MSRQRSKTHPAHGLPRGDRMLEDSAEDAYGLAGKLPDPSACTGCGCMYRDGRWTWGAPPADAKRVRCPACRRADDDQPAGLVVLEGDFVGEHAAEIRSLAENLEARQKQAHPLKRILRIEVHDDGHLELPTTDARLARAIGDAVHKAYAGKLDYRFTDAETLFRVHWSR